MSYVFKALWVAAFAAVLWGIDWAAQRGYFAKMRSSVNGERYTFSLPKWKRYFPVFSIAVLILVGVISGCTSGASDPAPAPVAAANCHGTYVGGYSPPEHDERIRLRNLSLAGRGIVVTADEAENNRNAGGGDPDGGIYMVGSFTFETDANCNITKGTTMVFHAYEYSIGGAVAKDGTFNLTWSGQGSQGDMKGKTEANNAITGKFFHPAPDSFVYGVLSGTFTPAVK